MDKYVRLDAVKKKIMEMTNDVRGADIAREVGGLSAEDVQEVKHGYWDHYGEYGECSLCGHVTNDFYYDKKDNIIWPNYCGNCGARLEVRR